jgi:hypothetical protein
MKAVQDRMLNGSLGLSPEMMLNVDRYAVYRCYSDGGELLYVGETGDLGTRLAAHIQKLWFTQVRGITLEWYADELDALNAERRAIHVEHPRINKQHRNAPTLAPRAAPRTRRSSPGDGKLTLEERARNLLAADPELHRPRMGGELARRLGVSPATGRRMHGRLAGKAPAGEARRAITAPREGERPEGRQEGIA